MRGITAKSFRAVLADEQAFRVAGAHDALGAALAQEAGFSAVWASSLEISAARCLPDASLLTMTDYLEAAVRMQRQVTIPVIADCDTGFGNNLNVAHLVHEYEAAGITAVCMEDKHYPKMNSFAPGRHEHDLIETEAFARKVSVAKQAQRGDEFFVVARTEAIISGLGVDEALRRCHAYVDAGADAILIHSKAKTNAEIVAFLDEWQRRAPVVIVPTTYPDWHFDDAVAAGASVVIYANQGLRATVEAVRGTYRTILAKGSSIDLEDELASVSDVFELQRLREWQELDR